MKHARSEAGNVFFLILLGVSLFAAFSMAIMRGQQGGTLNPEQDKLAATNIIKYGNTLKGAVDLLRANGISESDISFANNTVSGYGTVGAAPSAEVFNVNGAGIVYEKPEAKWLDGTSTAQTGYGEWIFTGENALRRVGTPMDTGDGLAYCSANDCKELVVILPYVKKSVCEAINNMTGFRNVDGTIPLDNVGTSIGFTKFTGSYTSGSPLMHIASDGVPNSVNTWGIEQGCIGGNGVTPMLGTYHYFKVLIAR